MELGELDRRARREVFVLRNFNICNTPHAIWITAILTVLSAACAFAQIVEPVPIEDFLARSDYSLRDNQRNLGRITTCAIGDLNNDGYGDMIVGAPRAPNSQFPNDTNTGIVYVRKGLNYGLASTDVDEFFFNLTPTFSQTTTDTLSAVNFTDAQSRIAGTQIDGDLPGALFGEVVAAGDFDGDGISDVAITASQRLGPQGPGRVYIIKGRSGWEGYTSATDEMDASRAMVVTGRVVGDEFGSSLDFEDVNGDGKEDLIIATPKGADGRGEVDVLFGRDFGPVIVAPIESSLTSPTVHIVGPTTNDGFGLAVKGGDVDNDGIGDIVIGAPLTDQFGEEDAGGAYIFFGGLDGTSGALPAEVEIPVFGINTTIVNRPKGEALGYSIGIGDVNGDGDNDLVLGAPFGNWRTSNNAGKVYVHYFRNQYVRGSFYDNFFQNDVVFFGEQPDERLGQSLVVDQLTTDSIADMLLMAPFGTPIGRQWAGRGFFIVGRSGIDALSGEIELNIINSDVLIYGDSAGEFTGSQMTTGDITGDGVSDTGFVGDRSTGVNPNGLSYWTLIGKYYKPRTLDVSPPGSVSGVPAAEWMMLKE